MKKQTLDFSKTMSFLDDIKVGTIIQWIGEEEIDLWDSTSDEDIELIAEDLSSNASLSPGLSDNSQLSIQIQVSKGLHSFLGPKQTIKQNDCLMFLGYYEVFDDFLENLCIRIRVLFGETLGFIEVYTEPIEAGYENYAISQIDLIKIIGPGISS